MASKTLASLIVRIGADTTGVTKGLGGLDKATRKAKNDIAGLGRNMNKVLVTMAAGFAGRILKNTVDLAARYETLGVVMGVVGRTAGRTRVEMEAFEASLQATGISMVESRSNLARMAAANIDLANSSELARVAQDAAVIGNVNSSEAFERLINGITTGQPKILRTLGIFVDFNASLEAGAAALGKTRNALTERESTQIRADAALEAGIHVAGAYESAMGTVGKQLNSTVRYMEDMRVKVGTAFLPEYTSAVFAYSNALKFLAEHAVGVARALKTLLAVLTALMVRFAALRVIALFRVAIALITPNALAAAASLQVMWASAMGPVYVVVAGLALIGVAIYKIIGRAKEATEALAAITIEKGKNKTLEILNDYRNGLAAVAKAAVDAAEEALSIEGLIATGKAQLALQTDLVGAYGQSEHAIARIRLAHKETAELHKNLTGGTVQRTEAQVAAMDKVTRAVYAQHRAMIDLQEQTDLMSRLSGGPSPLKLSETAIAAAAAWEATQARVIAAQVAISNGAISLFDLTPQEKTVKGAADTPMTSLLQKGQDFIGTIGETLGDGMKDLWAKMGPAGLAMAALFDIVGGIMEAVRPALDALREPLKMLGVLIGQTLAPVIELLTPIIIASVKSFSWLVQGIGYVIQALGWFIDKLVPDFISKVGQGLEQYGKDMVSNAKASRRAMDATNSLADALSAAATNIPKSLPLAYLRQQAGMTNPAGNGNTGGVTGGGGGGSGGGDDGKGNDGESDDEGIYGSNNTFSETISVVINGASDAKETAQAVMDEIRRQKGRGERIELDRHYQLREA